MNNKTLFLLEILKSQRHKITSKDLCRIGLCPVILNQIGIIYETKNKDGTLQTATPPAD